MSRRRRRAERPAAEREPGGRGAEPGKVGREPGGRGAEPGKVGREPGSAGRAAGSPGRRPAGAPDERPAPRHGFPSRFLLHTAILLGAFGIVSALAELAGAANLGVALGIGTFAFAIALVAVIVTD